MLPKEEIIQAINQEEKRKVYHWYFYIPNTLFILYIQQYLFRFPKFLIPPICSYNLMIQTYSLVRSSEIFPFFRLFEMEG